MVKQTLDITNMDLENTQVQMRKGILEFCILSIISRGEVYASDMIEELTSAKIVVVEGTLYPLLTRLRKAGLVDYKWVESVSGPPRKYYTLTPMGMSFLRNLMVTWTELVSSTHQIISKGHFGESTSVVDEVKVETPLTDFNAENI
jgi:PadR family transcriptional regulator PadR